VQRCTRRDDVIHQKDVQARQGAVGDKRIPDIDESLVAGQPNLRGSSPLPMEHLARLDSGESCKRGANTLRLIVTTLSKS
jgi:hypothetical protein